MTIALIILAILIGIGLGVFLDKLIWRNSDPLVNDIISETDPERQRVLLKEHLAATLDSLQVPEYTTQTSLSSERNIAMAKHHEHVELCCWDCQRCAFGEESDCPIVNEQTDPGTGCNCATLEELDDDGCGG